LAYDGTGNLQLDSGNVAPPLAIVKVSAQGLLGAACRRVEAWADVRPERETADLVCGRFTSSQRREAIGERFEVAVPETYQARYNLAPQQRALIVREHDERTRERMEAAFGEVLR
jgi:hypothetical protein